MHGSEGGESQEALLYPLSYLTYAFPRWSMGTRQNYFEPYITPAIKYLKIVIPACLLQAGPA